VRSLPEYNLIKTAGSWTGFKHSEETLAKMRGRKRSDETITRMVTAQPNVIPVEVTDLETNVTTSYDSLRRAGEVLGINHSTLRYYIKNNKPYKGRYFAQFKDL
jgi:hypothetical protein